MSSGWTWQGKRVAVLGGCGFFSSYLVPELLAAGAEVTAVDNFDNSDRDSLGAVADQVRIVEGDVRVAEVCDRVVAGQDVVLNLAARAFGLGYSNHHHGDMLVYNVLAGLPALEAARKHSVDRYLVVSTSCIYPDDSVIPTPELPVLEGLPEEVNEGYGWAKRIQEMAGSYYAAEYGMNISIVRPFNLYGANYAWGSLERAHVLPSLVKRVLDGEDPLIVWGSGRQKRNFLHGSDGARLLMRIVAANPVAKPVNLGYEDDVSIADLVDLICDVTGRNPTIQFDTSKPEGKFRKCADSSFLREITDGYEPKVSLREGVQEMVGWYERTFRSSQSAAL